MPRFLVRDTPEKVEVPRDTELQRKIIQFQLLQAHLQEIQRRQEIVNERLGELARTSAAFEELRTVKAGDAAMIPLGGENFVPGKITDTKNVLVSIGGGVAIKKSAQGAAEILKGRLGEMEKIADELAAEASATVSQLARLQPELEALSQRK